MSLFPFSSVHRSVVGDSREYEPSVDVDLVVTSPPYPMIEMWDSVFTEMNGEIESCIGVDSYEAFELMHQELDKVWESCTEACVEGGIVAVNIGNATRSTDDLGFTLFHNRERIVEWFTSNGYTLLPSIVWRKPTNKPNSYLGSGCLPTSQYVANDHEYVLLFRKGDRRRFEPKLDRRYSSAYFYHERNKWFSGSWSIGGESQQLDGVEREVTAAFPLEVPYRLIQMYSIYGDAVYDPFSGTGTTQLAALVSGRNSVGVDIDSEFKDVALSRLCDNGIDVSREWSSNRLADQRSRDFSEMKYECNLYDVKVKTKKERGIVLQSVSDVSRSGDVVEAKHQVYEE